MSRRFVFSVLLPVSYFVHAGLLWANPLEDLVGASPRIKAMGGAGTVLAQDFSAVFYNPANLARCQKNIVTVTYDFIQSNFTVSSSEPIVPQQIGSHHGGALGACLLPLTNLGLGIYASGGLQLPMDMRLSTVNSTPRLVMYDSGLKSPSIMAGLGYAPIKELSFGLAATFSVSAVIQQDVFFPVTGKNEFSSAMHSQIKPRIGFIAGITYEPMPSFRSAFVYRTSSFNQFNVNANITAAALIDAQVNFNMRTVLDYSPEQISFGFSYKPNSSLLIGADATYYMWSRYVAPFIAARPADNSPVAQSIRFAPEENASFRNILVPRFGVEYVFDKKTSVRAGYAFRPSPAPIPSKRANLIDGDTHRVTLGAGYRVETTSNFALVIDAFLGVDMMPHHTVHKEATAPVPQDYTFGGTALNTGIALSAEY